MGGPSRIPRPLVKPHAVWRFALTPAGGILVLDENGREPLRSPDRIERLDNWSLVAKAPELAAGLLTALDLLDRPNLTPEHLSAFRFWAVCVLSQIETDPAIRREVVDRSQQEMELTPPYAA